MEKYWKSNWRQHLSEKEHQSKSPCISGKEFETIDDIATSKVIENMQGLI